MTAPSCHALKLRGFTRSRFARARSRALGRLARARSRALRRLEAWPLAFVALFGLLSSVSAAAAQTWSAARVEPALWQIVAIDRSGESGWPYGREDIAGDGLATFAADEMAGDLRSVYADAQADALWLRAHVAGSDAPSASARAFFFINSDGNRKTGGSASGAPLDAALGDDPSAGGYELAVGLRGNGNLLGVWQWDVPMRKWVETSEPPAEDVRTELGSAADPLEIGAASHGYWQLELAHTLSGLSQSCGGSIFVRLVNEGSKKRTFADDAPEEIPCRSANDAYGDPIVLRSDGCSSDADCPAHGSCREGICLFGYPCTGDADCRSGERCTADQCVRVIEGDCSEASDCDGLVCDAKSCVACTESGAHACAKGLVCSPSGTCLDPDSFEPDSGGSTQVGKVRGGAFSCAAASATGRRAWLLSLPLLLILGFCARRRSARSRARAKRSARSPARAKRSARSPARARRRPTTAENDSATPGRPL